VPQSGHRLPAELPRPAASSSQVGAIHPLYLYSAMSDMSLRTSSCGRRASAPTSQESWTDCDGGCARPGRHAARND
jgi:hypothetical protein